MLYALSRTLLYLTALLALASCTRLDLAYRNLDVLIPWSLSDYLDMNRQQKRWLNEQLKEQLQWHCTTQLPGYLPWIDRLQAMVREGSASDAQLQALTHDAELAVKQVAQQITPSAVQLLQGLSDEQVATLRQAFTDDLAKRRKALVQPPLAEQIDERAERMQDRLKPWIGKLNDAQRTSVRAWSSQLGAQNRAWMDNREHWQTLLLAALEQRHQPGFAERIGQLLQERRALWTNDYRVAWNATELATRQLIIALLSTSTSEQRIQLLSRLEKLKSDFSELECFKSARKADDV